MSILVRHNIPVIFFRLVTWTIFNTFVLRLCFNLTFCGVEVLFDIRKRVVLRRLPYKYLAGRKIIHGL